MSNSNMLYLQMRNYLLELIAQNKNTPGYLLPSENQLAQKFNASRISAKHAYDTLEEEHLVIRQRGRGTFIANSTETNSDTLQQPLRPLPNLKIVAAIFPFINSTFMHELAEGIRMELSKRDIAFILLLTGSNQTKEAQLLQMAREYCHGILLFPGAFSKYRQEILELTINRFPLVQIDRYLPGLDLSYVSCDHFNAAYHAVKYLLERNYKKIGFVTHPAPHATSIVDRLAGFTKAVKEFDPQYPGYYKLTAMADTVNFEQLFTEYINQVRPEVIISSNVNFHCRILRILKKMELDRSVDLMIFDNVFQSTEDFMAYHPYIIDQQPREIGRTAAELLCRLMEEDMEPVHIALPEKIYRL